MHTPLECIDSCSLKLDECLPLLVMDVRPYILTCIVGLVLVAVVIELDGYSGSTPAICIHNAAERERTSVSWTSCPRQEADKSSLCCARYFSTAFASHGVSESDMLEHQTGRSASMGE